MSTKQGKLETQQRCSASTVDAAEDAGDIDVVHVSNMREQIVRMDQGEDGRVIAIIERLVSTGPILGVTKARPQKNLPGRWATSSHGGTLLPWLGRWDGRISVYDAAPMESGIRFGLSHLGWDGAMYPVAAYFMWLWPQERAIVCTLDFAPLDIPHRLDVHPSVGAAVVAWRGRTIDHDDEFVDVRSGTCLYRPDGASPCGFWPAILDVDSFDADAHACTFEPPVRLKPSCESFSLFR